MENSAKAARDYLPIPSAEAGIEREFSNDRDALGLRRHRLNALLFIRAIFPKSFSHKFEDYGSYTFIIHHIYT